MSILDVGSFDPHNPARQLNCGRHLKKLPFWKYVGLDIISGPNVNVIADSPYLYPFEDDTFDLVISANTLEHVEDTHAFVKELARVSKDWIIIIVPNTRSEHKYPIDCWRVFPDGMKFLLEKIAGLEIVYVGKGYNGSDIDTVGIARKRIKSPNNT
jgi:SAM-dependent methyltransferase